MLTQQVNQDTSGNCSNSNIFSIFKKPYKWSLQVQLLAQAAIDAFRTDATSIGASQGQVLSLGTAQGGLAVFAPTLANNGGKVIKVKSDASGTAITVTDPNTAILPQQLVYQMQELLELN